MIAVRRALEPTGGPSLEGLRHSQRIAQSVYFVARVDGRPLGTGHASVFPGTEADTHAQADASVLPANRRHGVGTALLRAVSERARELGKQGLQVEVKEDDAESLAFVERRGFVESEREKALELDLAALDVPEVRLPEGISIVTRAERPDLERGMYEVGREASTDIPVADDAAFDQTFEQWRSFEIERPSRDPALTFVALAGDEVVGYAALDVFPKAVFHGLTAVGRAWRRRGIGRALKLSQIAAAKAAGFARLETESEERNEPMRRLNESLGYVPIPGMVVLRGPLQLS